MTQTVREAYYAAVEAGTITNSEAEYRKFATGWAAAVQAINGPRPLADGPVVMIDMGSFEMGQEEPRNGFNAEIYEEGGEDPPPLRPHDWKPQPITTTLEITYRDKSTAWSGEDELWVTDKEDGSVTIEVRSASEQCAQSITLDPEHANLLAVFLLRHKQPVAYLMREDRRGRLNLRTDKGWKSKETAQAAALKGSGAWRVLTPVPVFEMPLLALNLVRPGYKSGQGRTPPPPPIAHGTPASEDGALMHPDIYTAVAASVQPVETGKERIVGKHRALGMGYGTLGEAGQRAYHGLPPEDGQ